jgi:hypothetical protein
MATSIYELAFELSLIVDDQINKGTRHYRTKDGQLILHLDEYIRAALDDTLDAPSLGDILCCILSKVIATSPRLNFVHIPQFEEHETTNVLQVTRWEDPKIQREPLPGAKK